MDSPILNAFIADHFRVRSPSPSEVDWFDLSSSGRVRRFTFSKPDSWREIVTEPVTGGQLNTNSDIIVPVRPRTHNIFVFQDGLRMHPVHTRRASAADVHYIGRGNTTQDGLRMHPTTARRPHSCTGLEMPSDEQWANFDPVLEEFHASQRDLAVPIIRGGQDYSSTHSDNEYQDTPSVRGEFCELSNRRASCKVLKLISWVKGKLADLKT